MPYTARWLSWPGGGAEDAKKAAARRAQKHTPVRAAQELSPSLLSLTHQLLLLHGVHGERL